MIFTPPKRLPCFIGIAGGSGAGKSYFAHLLKQRLGSSVVSAILPLDAYYKGLPQSQSKEDYNFDHPDAIDWHLIKSHIKLLRASSPVEVPVYNFENHQRTGSEALLAAEVYIVEGTMLYADYELSSLLDLKIYIDVDEDLRLSRRVDRDTQERGRTQKDIFEQFNKFVRPMHKKYIQPTKAVSDIVIGDDPVEYSLDRIIKLVSQIENGAKSHPDGATTDKIQE